MNERLATGAFDARPTCTPEEALARVIERSPEHLAIRMIGGRVIEVETKLRSSNPGEHFFSRVYGVFPPRAVKPILFLRRTLVDDLSTLAVTPHREWRFVDEEKHSRSITLTAIELAAALREEFGEEDEAPYRASAERIIDRIEARR